MGVPTGARIETRLNYQVADGSDHHKLPSFPHLRAAGDSSIEEIMLQRASWGELGPSDPIRRPLVHRQTRLRVDIDTPAHCRKEPAQYVCCRMMVMFGTCGVWRGELAPGIGWSLGIHAPSGSFYRVS